MNNDLISRESTIEELDKICCPDFVPEWYENAFYEMKDTLMGVIQEVPSAQPKTAHWKPLFKMVGKDFGCSECGAVVTLAYECFKDGCYYDYCPYCGVKMEGEL